jgi:hypothetical protein
MLSTPGNLVNVDSLVLTDTNSSSSQTVPKSSGRLGVRDHLQALPGAPGIGLLALVLLFAQSASKKKGQNKSKNKKKNKQKTLLKYSSSPIFRHCLLLNKGKTKLFFPPVRWFD